MTGGIRGRKVGDKSPITKNLFLIKSVQYSSSLKRAGVIDCQSFMSYRRLVHKQTLPKRQ